MQGQRRGPAVSQAWSPAAHFQPPPPPPPPPPPHHIRTVPNPAPKLSTAAAGAASFPPTLVLTSTLNPLRTFFFVPALHWHRGGNERARLWNETQYYPPRPALVHASRVQTVTGLRSLLSFLRPCGSRLESSHGADQSSRRPRGTTLPNIPPPPSQHRPWSYADQ